MESSDADKDGVAVAMQSRIDEALRWEAPQFAKIIDLKEIHYEEVVRLIKHHFFKDEPMCKSSFLPDDVESVKGYLDLVRVWMKDSTSIVALSSNSGRVIGTAITRINDIHEKTNTYSRVQIFQGKTLEMIMHLKSTLVKQASVYEVFNTDAIFRVYILCVHPSYRDKGLATGLLEACVQIAGSLRLSAIAGVFTSGVDQKLATDLGFRSLSEIRYSRWIIDNRVVFDNPGLGNYSASFMGMPVPGSDELRERRRARKSLYKKLRVHKYLCPP